MYRRAANRLPAVQSSKKHLIECLRIDAVVIHDLGDHDRFLLRSSRGQSSCCRHQSVKCAHRRRLLRSDERHEGLNDFVKLLLIGDSKSGKTGSLVSLVKAGYKLRVLDFDNLLDVLKYYVQKECPELIGNVEYRTLRDKRKSSPEGPIIDGAPRAFSDAMKMLDNWKYTEDGHETDLGKPSEWGPDCILVLDSLSRLCDAAYDFRIPLTPRGKGGEFDGRAVYGDAQDAVENCLAKGFALRTYREAAEDFSRLEREKCWPGHCVNSNEEDLPSYNMPVAEIQF